MEAVLSVARSVEPDLRSLGCFAILWAACSLSGLIISGLLPLGARANSSAPLGFGLVIGNAILLVLLLIGTVVFAASTLRLSSIILMGSWIFLFSPAIFNVVPQRWLDSYAGLLVLLCIQAAAVMMLGQSAHFANALSL